MRVRQLINYREHYLGNVRRAILKLRASEGTLINVKRIRQIFKVENSNRSLINFYWTSLEQLEREGLIERIGNGKPKLYRVIPKQTEEEF